MTGYRIVEDQEIWDAFVQTNEGHPLQLWGWGEVKSAHNWSVLRIFITDEDETIGAAQLLIRALPFPLKQLVYVPRGPVCTQQKRTLVVKKIADFVKKNLSAVAISIEPDWQDFPDAPGWRVAKQTILIPRTIIFDLSKNPEELQDAMTKKTRQYIRKSMKSTLEFREVTDKNDIVPLLEIYQQTADRAHFSLHKAQYYFDIFEKMGKSSPVFAAYEEGRAVAFLWFAQSQATAFELYGGMNARGQELRANYGLKWFAIVEMQARGVRRYDVNGLLNDGVTQFKLGFSQEEIRLAGTYDFAFSPLYAVWQKGLPLAKKIIRLVKK